MKTFKPLIVTLLAIAALIGLGTTAVALNPGTWTTDGVVSIQDKPTATSDQNKVLTVSTADRYQLSTLVNANVASTAAIALSKLAPGTAGQLVMNNATPAVAPITMSGDGTISSTGALAVTKINGATAPASPTSQTGYSIVASGDGAYTNGDSRGFQCWAGANMGSSTGSIYLPWAAGTSTPAGVQSVGQVLIPRGATIDGMYAALVGLKLATANVVFTIEKVTPSGDPPWTGTSSGVTCTINAGASTCNDVGHTASVAAGDLLDVLSVASASDGTASKPRVCIRLRYGP